jgi:lysophospholipid acyltransferase (LPLAT)-like uncharacterized protein
MNPLLAVAPPLAAGLVRLLGPTLRLRAEGVEVLTPSWTAARPLIYCVWHGRILMVPWLNARLRRSHGARTVSVLASRSRDGGLVGDYARRFGLDVVRGSSSRGGAGALRALVTTVEAGRDVALAPDGPRGPRRQLGSGVVALAALTRRRWCRWGSPRVRRGAWPHGTSSRSRRRSRRLRRRRAASVARDADRERARKEIGEASARPRPPPTGW